MQTIELATLPEPGILPFATREQVAHVKLHLLMARFRTGIRYLAREDNLGNFLHEEVARLQFILGVLQR